MNARPWVPLAASLCLHADAAAQCGPAYLNGHSGAALSGRVRAICTWDPDGPGPRRAMPVVGGRFTSAGTTTLNNIALWTEDGWQALGGGLTGGLGQVSALAVLPTGRLVAAGHFLSAGGVPVESIAAWDGSSWRALGGGLTGMSTVTVGGVRALLVLPGGDLLAGGEFNLADGQLARAIARWDGVAWHPLANGLTTTATYDAAVFALAAHPDGSLYAVGQFNRSGAAVLSHVARWDGASWADVGGGANAFVTAIAITGDGDVLVGGGFSMAGTTSASRVARWDGSAWSALGSGLSDAVRGLCIGPSGEVVATGFFTHSGSQARNRVARWDGTTWQQMGSGLSAEGLVVARHWSGELMFGGEFLTAGGVSSAYFVRRSEDRRPWIVEDPSDVDIDCGHGASMSVVVAPGFDNPQFQWRRGGVAIDINENPSAQSATLLLSGESEPGSYDCVVSTACGSDMSRSATLDVTPCCPADLNHDGFVNADDYDLFAESFDAGDLAADFNQDGFVNADDYDLFAESFDAGC